MLFRSYSPKGVIVQSVDGVRLDGTVSAKRVYEFIVEEYGAYSVEYKVTDYTGNMKRYSFVLNSRDVEPPTIVVEGKYATTAKKGAEISIAKAVVEDNHSEEMSVYTFVYKPDGTIVEVQAGKFKADKVGVYTVYYYAFDAAGNAITFHYQITVS